MITQSFLNFPLIPRIRSAGRIREIGKNLQTLKIFHFLNLEGTTLVCQIIDI